MERDFFRGLFHPFKIKSKKKKYSFGQKMENIYLQPLVTCISIESYFINYLWKNNY